MTSQVAILGAGVMGETLLSGLIRAGRLIQYIPYPVTLGFTAGIGIVIATLQLKDLLGLSTTGHAEHYIEQLGALLQALPSARLGDGIIGVMCLAVLIVWAVYGPRGPFSR